MAKDEAKKMGQDAANPEYKLNARSEFAGGDYKGAVIDSAHMINLSAEASFLHKKGPHKQPPQSSAQGLASSRDVGPSAK